MLADTSVWINHLRSGDNDPAVLLESNRIMTHPFVVGEIAPGNLNNRAGILSSLQNLPMTPVANDPEVLFFIGQQRLAGRGIGYVDAHFLAATGLIPPARLWTQDKKPWAVADTLELARKAN